LVAITDKVENYPGFPEGVNGYELVSRMEAQAKRFGLEIISAEVKVISQEGGRFLIRADGQEYQASAVIIATGSIARRIGVNNEDKFQGRGVSYCATCDAPFFKNKEIVVVGGGDTAVEEALFLTNFVRKIYLVHRRDKLRATPILQGRILNHPKIQFYWDSVVSEIIGTERPKGVKIKNIRSGEITELAIDGIFIFIGFIPNTGFLKEFIELDQDGYIVIDSEMRTSRKGVYACGDVVKKNMRQIINACGEGATAAFNARYFVEALKGNRY
jgi:thioredoxin reductase (NADPH)